MTQHKPLPSVSEIKSRLEYCPDTGTWTWISGKFQGMPAGTISSRKKPYIRININGYPFLAHRLAWAYMTGEDPGEMQVDHRDNNKMNNCWSNLRIATSGQNRWNTPKQKNNTSGHKGLRLIKVVGKYFYYQATVRVDGVVHKKTTKSRAVALRWLLAKRREFHGDFAAS